MPNTDPKENKIKLTRSQQKRKKSRVYNRNTNSYINKTASPIWCVDSTNPIISSLKAVDIITKVKQDLLVPTSIVTMWTALLCNFIDLDTRIVNNPNLPISWEYILGPNPLPIVAICHEHSELQRLCWCSICVPYSAIVSSQESPIWWTNLQICKPNTLTSSEEF